MKKEAATLSVRVARHLLRRTRLLAHPAVRKAASSVSTDTAAPDGYVTLAPPRMPVPTVEQRDDEMARQLHELRARVDRAESAAAWLRARLRAERQQRPPAPQFDAAALASDLTRDLARLPTLHREAVRRVVYRTLAAHGLPVTAPDDERAERTCAGAVPLWPREQQEALAEQVLARAPDVASPSYVYRVLELLAARGSLTLPELTRAAEYTSAMARRRLRLTVDALVALGALTMREGAYALNMAWTPPPAKEPGRNAKGRGKITR